MKNTTSGPEDSIFRKKGFFIALYSCLGAVAILALVITIANFGQPSFQADAYEEDAAYVGADQVEPYRAQADEEAWFRPRATPPPTPPAPALPTPPAQPTPRPTQPPANQPEAEDEAVASTPEPAPAADTEAEAETEAEASPEVSPEAAPAEAFTPFAGGRELLWPVEGEIVMHFSIDALIYDPTLDQFRTNDDIRITAEGGTHVQSGAEGRVLAIGRNVVRGNYVEIDHGNGWIATYGQLADSKQVAVGDIVRAGQIIGSVGEPSIFGYLHGTHVNLHVTQNDEPVDPYALLVALGD